jgi:hypothetical protein
MGRRKGSRMSDKIKKTFAQHMQDLTTWFNRYELQYRILMLVAVVYLLISHYIGC